MVSRHSDRSVGTQQIVCMLDTKSGEDEVGDIRANGRGGKWCPLNCSWMWCSEKEMTRNDK